MNTHRSPLPLPSWTRPLVKSFGLSEASRLSLGQGWLAEQESAFRPAEVRLVNRGGALEILAVMIDDHVGNAVRGFNEKTWLNGDVFEIFLQPQPRLYFELHVTPENQRLFLRWRPADEVASATKVHSFEEALIHEQDFIESRTWVEAGGWAVWARVAWAKVGISDEAEAGFKAAFTRYDYGPDLSGPVLSGTPRFPRPNFHDRLHWHTFTPGALLARPDSA